MSKLQIISIKISFGVSGDYLQRLLAAVLVFTASAAYADVYKCTLSGRTVWNGNPCKDGGAAVVLKYERASEATQISATASATFTAV